MYARWFSMRVTNKLLYYYLFSYMFGVMHLKPNFWGRQDGETV
ncbi:hypothetical protein SAMN04487866_101345 [Thermoactinomyces sp. DSM 45891]|nr:hypothetical protein SAMN04487866_101345 [Thermoactinomyces sp. DSM 45891]